MIRGFVLKKLRKCKKDGSNRNVFIFNESEDLLNFINQYKQK